MALRRDLRPRRRRERAGLRRLGRHRAIARPRPRSGKITPKRKRIAHRHHDINEQPKGKGRRAGPKLEPNEGGGVGRGEGSFVRGRGKGSGLRPAPPRAVIDAIVTASTSRRAGSVAALGSLSVLLAEFGVELVAIELGPHGARRAQFERFPHAGRGGPVRGVPLPARGFAAVIGASAMGSTANLILDAPPRRGQVAPSPFCRCTMCEVEPRGSSPRRRRSKR